MPHEMRHRFPLGDARLRGDPDTSIGTNAGIKPGMTEGAGNVAAGRDGASGFLAYDFVQYDGARRTNETIFVCAPSSLCYLNFVLLNVFRSPAENVVCAAPPTTVAVWSVGMSDGTDVQ
jgi:hypothetical protein